MIEQLAVAFVGGLASTITPCVLPLHPGVGLWDLSVNFPFALLYLAA